MEEEENGRWENATRWNAQRPKNLYCYYDLDI